MSVQSNPDRSNWWEHFFEGLSVELWLRAMSDEDTRREADSFERALGVPPGAELLDVPCGGGRLSLALAERGYRVTGVDLSREFLAHARSREGAHRVTWEQRDMRNLPWRARFDAALCVGNSFGYLDDEGNAAFLRAVYASLKPSGRLVLETPMIVENLLRHVRERPWWKVCDMYLLVANHYDHARSRLDTEYTFVSNGRVEVRQASHRAYTYRELVALIESAGFAVETSEPWSRDAHTLTFIATRSP